MCGVLNSLERNKVYETQLKRSEQRRSGPTIAEEMDKLWEKARPMEQNVAEVQRGSNVHASQMPLPGAASPLAGREILFESFVIEFQMRSHSQTRE